MIASAADARRKAQQKKEKNCLDSIEARKPATELFTIVRHISRSRFSSSFRAASRSRGCCAVAARERTIGGRRPIAVAPLSRRTKHQPNIKIQQCVLGSALLPPPRLLPRPLCATVQTHKSRSCSRSRRSAKARLAETKENKGQSKRLFSSPGFPLSARSALLFEQKRIILLHRREKVLKQNAAAANANNNNNIIVN